MVEKKNPLNWPESIGVNNFIHHIIKINDLF